MTTDETRRIAQSYFEAWSTRQGPDALRPLMAEDFTFRAGDMVVEGREAFFDGAGWPEHAVTTMLAEAYDGSVAFQLYEARNGDAAVQIADHLTVDDGRIVSAEVICDAASFMAFMAAR